MHLQIDYKTHLRLKNIKAPTAITATPNPAAANIKMLLSFWPSVGSLVCGAAVEVKDIEIKSRVKLEQKEHEIEDHLLHNEPALLKPVVRSNEEIKK